jgi:SAM-dependent methyltransferase
MAKLHRPDETFDALIDSGAVFCNDFDESRQICAEMHRVARPGARLVVRTFATDSWGNGVGESVGYRRFVAAVGLLAGAGPSRFTDRNELSELPGNWRIAEVNLTTRSWYAGRRTIRKWIAEAHKDRA